MIRPQKGGKEVARDGAGFHLELSCLLEHCLHLMKEKLRNKLKISGLSN